MKTIIIIAMTAIITSCQFFTDKKPTIGFMVPSYDASRFVKEKDFLKAKAEQFGINVIDANASYDDKKQLQQAAELIEMGADVLVIIAVNDKTAASMVRMAKENNVKIIAYERMISNADVDVFIGPDGFEIGVQLAEYAVSKKPSGKYILLGGDHSDEGANKLRSGALSILKPLEQSGKLKILYDIQIEDWDQENAYIETEKYLRLSLDTPDVIVSAYDGLSYGAIRALNKNEINPLPLITGQDAELEACQNIQKGTQTMTIFRSYKQQAELAAELAFKLIRKEKINTGATLNNGRYDVPAAIIESKIIDKSNLQQVLQNEKLYDTKLISMN